MKLNLLTRGALVALCLSLLVGAAGCGLWESTKKIYKGAILPAEVDLDQESGLSETEQLMARLFKEIDQHIEDLSRELLVQEGLPDQEWMQSQTSQFPWLNGIMAWHRDGRLVAKFPEHSIKQPDLQGLQTTNSTSIQNLRSLTFQVQASDLGPELFIIRPLYQAAAPNGSIAAHFDPRSLASLSDDPGRLLLFTPEHMLWDGHHETMSEKLAGIDWNQELEHRAAGRVEIEDRAFYWMARYIGDKPLFYAVEARQ